MWAIYCSGSKRSTVPGKDQRIRALTAAKEGDEPILYLAVVLRLAVILHEPYFVVKQVNSR